MKITRSGATKNGLWPAIIREIRLFPLLPTLKFGNDTRYQPHLVAPTLSDSFSLKEMCLGLGSVYRSREIRNVKMQRLIIDFKPK